MHYLRRLYCYLYGHETCTVVMPLPDVRRHEVIVSCLRCGQSAQQTYPDED